MPVATMTSFDEFLNICGKMENNHRIEIANSFAGWKQIFTKVRSGSGEKLRSGMSQPIVQGIITYGLSDEEAFFILSYTASFSSWINLPLRCGDPLTMCQAYYAENLIMALSKLPHCNCEYLYRMDTPLCGKAEELAWFKRKIGSVIKVPNFLSVAKSNWDNTELTWKIYTIKGRSNAIDLEQCRNNPSEDEAIYQSDSLFEIKGVDGELVVLDEVENTTIATIEMIGNYVGCC